jgi:hypothetical protein
MSSGFCANDVAIPVPTKPPTRGSPETAELTAKFSHSLQVNFKNKHSVVGMFEFTNLDPGYTILVVWDVLLGNIDAILNIYYGI